MNVLCIRISRPEQLLGLGLTRREVSARIASRWRKNNGTHNKCNNNVQICDNPTACFGHPQIGIQQRRTQHANIAYNYRRINENENNKP